MKDKVSQFVHCKPFLQNCKLKSSTVCYYHITYEFQSESTICSLHECQGTPCSKQAPYLKFKWQQRDSNSQPLSSQTNTQPFSQTGQMIELCCEYLSVRCIWLYVIIMSRTSFRVNPHSFWVRITLLSLKPQIWRLLRARSSLTFTQTIKCGFTLKLVRDMIITYSQMYGTDKYSQHNLIIWPVWLDGSMFVYKVGIANDIILFPSFILQCCIYLQFS